jgi:hypothetical protein
MKESKRMYEKNYKESVDFKEKIGIWRDKEGVLPDTDTSFGIIHYAKKGAHIVPSIPNTIKREMTISSIRCSVQVALLGHVVNNLRAVAVEHHDNYAKLLFYYDNTPSEEELELASLVDTEFLSDFCLPEFQTDFEVFTVPFPERIPRKGFLVYLEADRK